MRIPLIPILILVCALSVCGSEAVSVFLRLNLRKSDLSSHVTARRTRRFLQNDPIFFLMSNSPTFGWKRHGILPPPNDAFHNSSPMHTFPTTAPAQRSTTKHSKKAFAPPTSPFKHRAKKTVHGSVSSPSLSFYKHHHTKTKIISLSPERSNQLPSSTYTHRGAARSLTFGSRPSSASVSFSSSLLPYTGTAKIFSLSDIERATDNFEDSRILGEGGFGLVYSGTLDDGRKVAVKVLKRDDHQGSREFLAEAEMLSRLHHRNLIKLIGICTEDHTRCLIYELVPNGSVESHLHGTYVMKSIDQGSLWFTGMIRTEIYSYGVVLVELLSGRKPVDWSQPPGQENLVAWARPLLSYKEGLETLVDLSLNPNIPFDNAAKVAAIASMCVQPDASHRPFMGEVVQALKLVCNEFDETKESESRSCSHKDLCIDVDNKVSSKISGELVEVSGTGYPISSYDSIFDTEIALSAGFEGEEFGSFRRHANFAPLRMGRGRKFWQRLRGVSSGSMSEHGFPLKL